MREIRPHKPTVPCRLSIGSPHCHSVIGPAYEAAEGLGLASSPCTCCAQSLHVPEEGLPVWLPAAAWNVLPLCLGSSCSHCSCGRHLPPRCLELPWLTTRARCGLSFRWRIRGALCNSPGSGCLVPPDFSPCLFPLLILLCVSCCNKLTVSFVSPSESSGLGCGLGGPQHSLLYLLVPETCAAEFQVEAEEDGVGFIPRPRPWADHTLGQLEA